MERKISLKRVTKETDITLTLNLDGRGSPRIETGIPFMNHMLTLFAVHGGFDLEILAKGDLEVDDHHTVEDVGIVLGQAISKALGERKGITRYGEATLPMDEALAGVYLDLSNRPYLCYKVDYPAQKSGSFDLELVEEFFRAVAFNGGITLHIHKICGKNGHHIAEAVFKGFARALCQSVRVTGDGETLPSSKGVL
ncbi:MAG: imidazoleglycerol-phosphate dehydratase HisB [Deltaproteobacteria bacterium]|nr:MAG: imidazoleglycerol-phosphate dehydratase HisB [Deltaproteobacteria bacterium]